MNQTEHKSITALMKAIKRDMESGITQIAVIVEESEDKAKKKYIYSRPFVNEGKGEKKNES
jgi:hypothetical protein